MNRNIIVVTITGDADNVAALCGFYYDLVDTQQIAEYTVNSGFATITALMPVYKTVLDLKLPFTFPVTDLGSGILKAVTINANTEVAYPAICNTKQWADRRTLAAPVSVPMQLIADYCTLL